MNREKAKEILDNISIRAVNELEILEYIGGLEEENKKLWERHNEEHNQISKALDKISKLKPQIPNEIPSWLDELEDILRGKDNEN